MKISQIKEKIAGFMKNQVGDKPAIVGLSGGVDSAVVAFLASEALGSDNVHGILSPSSSNTKEDLKLAKLVAKKLGIKYKIINIDKIVKIFQKQAGFFRNKTTVGNLKARIRMCLLYGKANAINGVILGTGNKSELATGYFTKHGDGAVDILPIGDLYKTQVYELAKYLGVPKKIISRSPTAGLWKNQYDEKELGITYKKLDKILLALEKRRTLDKFNEAELELVKKLIRNSEHKRQKPPVCKI